MRACVKSDLSIKLECRGKAFRTGMARRKCDFPAFSGQLGKTGNQTSISLINYLFRVDPGRKIRPFVVHGCESTTGKAWRLSGDRTSSFPPVGVMAFPGASPSTHSK